jgi:hypothetical protein
MVSSVPNDLRRPRAAPIRTDLMEDQMGFLDDAKAKLTDAVDKHGDKIADGLDRAGAAVDKQTGGKHSDKITTGVAKAKEGLDRLDGRRDDFSATTTEPAPDPDVVPSPGPEPTTPPTPEPAPSPDQPGLPTDPANPATGAARLR